MRAYLLICAAVFVIGCVWRILRVWRMPTHLRWELYPMPRGSAGQRQYGGSYFEHSDWWRKKSKHSRLAEITYIAGEVFAFRTVWKRNRPLWLWSWLMHLGLYALVTAAGLTALAAVTDFDWAEPVRWTAIAGACAGIAGALGLLVKRIEQPQARSGWRDYLNLAAILAVCVTALEAGSLATAPGELTGFMRALLWQGTVPDVQPAVTLHLIIVGAFLAYFPATHMTHAFMKFFTFHRVRWDDKPLVHDRRLAASIAANLARPLSWSGPHVGAGQTWERAAAPGPVVRP